MRLKWLFYWYFVVLFSWLMFCVIEVEIVQVLYKLSKKSKQNQWMISLNFKRQTLNRKRRSVILIQCWYIDRLHLQSQQTTPLMIRIVFAIHFPTFIYLLPVSSFIFYIIKEQVTNASTFRMELKTDGRKQSVRNELSIESAEVICRVNGA